LPRSSPETPPQESPLLGAHVSIAGGIALAPERGAAIGANAIQIFTKQVQRWAEPAVDAETADAFCERRKQHGIQVAGSHDSYLINLASPDPQLRERSYRSFCRELERCHALGLDFLVTHPGNATDGDRAAGIARNAEAIRRAVDEVECRTPVLIEATAGQGTALGCTFEELARLLELIGPAHDQRLGICLDTAHLFAAGYDLRDDYDGVMDRLDRVTGLAPVQLVHLNDSKAALGSRVDRHEEIGQGRLGPDPFRRIMRDARLRGVPKVLETPKGDDPVRFDRRNLRRLRSYLTT
jgi:deoxyribonuclease-4